MKKAVPFATNQAIVQLSDGLQGAMTAWTLTGTGHKSLYVDSSHMHDL
jgi:hypothetical protein